LSPRWWNPLDDSRVGVVRTEVEQECVERPRRFTLRLTHAHGSIDLATFERDVGPTPQPLEASVILQRGVADGLGHVDLVLVVDPGTASEQTMTNGAKRIPIVVESWLTAHGVVATLIGTGAIFLAVTCAFAIVSLLRRRNRRPLFIKTIAGSAVRIVRNVPVTIGGPGATIVIAEAPERQVLATASWDGNHDGHLQLSPCAPIRIELDGISVDGSTLYQLGRPLRVDMGDGKTAFGLTLLRSSDRELALVVGGTVLRSNVSSTQGLFTIAPGSMSRSGAELRI
jgi:hypothetical protein